MKLRVFVGTLAAAVVVAMAADAIGVAAQSQAGTTGQPAKRARAAGAQGTEGHTAPKTQPETAPPPSVPTGEMQLVTVRIPKGVKADGKPLAAGTYQVRLTAQDAAPEAKGQTQGLERWAEFMQGKQVKGREIVTIIPQSEVSQVQKDAAPAPNTAKVQTLKGGDFVRVWINKGGNQYLIHLPTT